MLTLRNQTILIIITASDGCSSGTRAWGGGGGGGSLVYIPVNDFHDSNDL